MDLSKCFCIPEVVKLVIAAASFLCVYGIYLLLLIIFNKLKKKGGIWTHLTEEMRYPIFWILIEIAAIFSLHILQLPEKITHILERGLNILLIGTIGWFFGKGITAFYHNYMHKVGDLRIDPSRRGAVTQIIFLYRLVIFLIITMTVAAILLTFPYIKSVGVGILSSAGIVGIALGIAARPILLNLMAGIQIAINKTINIGDAVIVEGELARIEAIHLTHVIVCTADLRRIVVPISYFIDKPFQNWDIHHSELLATINLYCDYTTPVDVLRKKAAELTQAHHCWNKKTFSVQVIDCTESTIKIRILASTDNVSAATELHTFLREKLIDFLQKEYPIALPTVRNLQL